MKLCYGCGGDDHYIRDCPQRNDRVSARPSIQSGSGPSNRGRGPRQAHSGSQGKGKGQQSNAPTYQESRAPARVYHIRGKDEEESPDVIAGTVDLNSVPTYTLIDSGSTHSFIYACES